MAGLVDLYVTMSSCKDVDPSYIDEVPYFLSLQYDEAEKRREMAKNSLERYTHYYERWATNQSVCTCLVYHSLSVYDWGLFVFPTCRPKQALMFDLSTSDNG